MPKKVLLVDLCGTLFASNTTFDFLEFLLSGNTSYRQFIARSTSLGGRVANRLLPGDRRRQQAIRFLEGYERQQLLESAEVFLDTIRPIDEVLARVEALRRDADATLLLSSSLDFIVECACDKLAFDGFRATRLEYDDGICTGRVESELLGNKAALIGAEFALDECVIVTDNRSDADCRRVVSRLVGVAAAADRGMVAFWSGKVDELVLYEG